MAGPQDALQRQIDELRRERDADHAVTIDLQVRVAKLEALRPVSKDEFDPIKRLVWGFVSTVLGIVLIAVLAVVINKTGVPITH